MLLSDTNCHLRYSRWKEKKIRRNWGMTRMDWEARTHDLCRIAIFWRTRVSRQDFPPMRNVWCKTPSSINWPSTWRKVMKMRNTRKNMKKLTSKKYKYFLFGVENIHIKKTMIGTIEGTNLNSWVWILWKRALVGSNLTAKLFSSIKSDLVNNVWFLLSLSFLHIFFMREEHLSL